VLPHGTNGPVIDGRSPADSSNEIGNGCRRGRARRVNGARILNCKGAPKKAGHWRGAKRGKSYHLRKRLEQLGVVLAWDGGVNPLERKERRKKGESQDRRAQVRALQPIYDLVSGRKNLLLLLGKGAHSGVRGNAQVDLGAIFNRGRKKKGEH